MDDLLTKHLGEYFTECVDDKSNREAKIIRHGVDNVTALLDNFLLGRKFSVFLFLFFFSLKKIDSCGLKRHIDQLHHMN